MGRGPGPLGDGERSPVVRLPGSPSEPPSAPVTPPGRLHGLAIAGAAIFGLTSIVSVLLFIVVRWPADTGRFVKVAIVASLLGLVVSGVAAIFAAARDTYPRSRGTTDDG